MWRRKISLINSLRITSLRSRYHSPHWSLSKNFIVDFRKMIRIKNEWFTKWKVWVIHLGAFKLIRNCSRKYWGTRLIMEMVKWKIKIRFCHPTTGPRKVSPLHKWTTTAWTKCNLKRFKLLVRDTHNSLRSSKTHLCICHSMASSTVYRTAQSNQQPTYNPSSSSHSPTCPSSTR